jgi:hypothetical protein
VQLLVASAVIVCLASLTGHAEAASVALGEQLAGSPHARVRSIRPQAVRHEVSLRAESISSARANPGTFPATRARSLRSILTQTAVVCSTSIAALRRASRASAVEERRTMPRRRGFRLRSPAKRTRSVGRGVSSSLLQANRAGASNIRGASAREELASPTPLRAPPGWR